MTPTDDVNRTVLKAPHRPFPALLTIAVSGCLLASSVLAQAPEVTEGEVVDRIVLRINDRIATLWEYQRQLASIERQIVRGGGLDPARQQEALLNAPREVMRSIFDELLILSRADQLGIRVSRSQLDEVVARQIEQFDFPDEAALRAALAREGMTLEQYRAQLEKQMLWRRVTGQEVRIDVPEEELRDLYVERSDEFRVPDRRRLREIVVLEEGGRDATERSVVAEGIGAAWRTGGDPAQLVAELGQNVAVLLEVGWIARDEIASELRDQVWDLEVGEISAPVEGRGGLHVMKMLEAEEASLRPFQEVRGQLLAQERNRRLESELSSYLKELEAKAYFAADLPAELSDFKTASGSLVREGGNQLLERAAPDPSEQTRTSEQPGQAEDG